MTRFEIIVEIDGKQKYIDTEGVESISLNFNIADITEPDKRNSSYSKTIKIPETRNNRAIFGDISDLTIDSQFNPNKKSRCWILVDTIVVFEGNLQLKKISMDWRYDTSFYECVIYADNDGFFKEIGEDFLTDLNWDELNHEWQISSMTASWVQEWVYGYFYPLIDYGYDFNYGDINAPFIIGTAGVNPNPGIKEEQLFPATNVKYTLDKIFRNAGYSYTSTFFETNEFKNLYMPYNGPGKYRRNPNDLSGRFSVFNFGNLLPSHTLLNYRLDYPFVISGFLPTFFGIQTYGTDFEVVPITGELGGNGYRITMDDETSPGGDPDGVWSLDRYTAPANVTSQRFNYNFDIEFPVRLLLDPNALAGSENFNGFVFPTFEAYPGIEIKRTYDPNGVAVPGGYKVFVNGSNARVPFTNERIPSIEYLDVEPCRVPVDGQGTQFPNVYNLRYLPKRVRGQITTDLFGPDELNHSLIPGEEVWVEYYLTAKPLQLRLQIFQKNYPNINIDDIRPGDLNFFNAQPLGLQWQGLVTGAYPVPEFLDNTPYNILWGYPTIWGVNGLWLDRTQMVSEIYSYKPFTTGNPVNDSVGFGNFFNNLSEYHIPGDTIPYIQNIPTQFKQKDFITSLIKMFNLYIEPDKNNKKNLIIEPRDIFYEDAEIKDWTLKLDTNSNVDETILAETQNRSILLSYKPDKDFYNEDYTSKLKNIYGEYEIFVENDFTKNQRKIEPQFSPTPLVPMTGTNRIIIPKIGKLNNGVFGQTDTNVRILTRYARTSDKTWVYNYGAPNTQLNVFPNYTILYNTNALDHNFEVGDLVSISNPTFPFLNGIFTILYIVNSTSIIIDFLAGISILVNYPPNWIANGNVETQDGLMPIGHYGLKLKIQNTEITYVPYLGHLDNPFNSRYDLNFGQSITYFEYKTLTNNNLYTLYYENFFNDIISKDSKIVSAQFYLTAADIADFSFSDIIYLKNQYFKVNKITNYDPTKEKLTQVELIKSGVGSVVKKIQNTRPITRPIEVPGDAIDIVERVSILQNTLSNPSNDVRQTNSLVGGMDNYVYAQNSLVIGEKNKVAGDSNFIFGNENTIQSSTRGNLIFGSGNELSSGIRNTFVVGSDTRVFNSDIVQISSRFIVTSNFISAGRDEVLNLYFDNKPSNYISASRDAIREFGSQDPISYITANIDAV